MPAAAAQGEGAVDCKRLPDPRRQKFPPESQAEGAHGRCVGRAGSPRYRRLKRTKIGQFGWYRGGCTSSRRAEATFFCCSRR